MTCPLITLVSHRHSYLAHPLTKPYLRPLGPQESLSMADLLERLKVALADRYDIERELGSGGMATAPHILVGSIQMPIPI